MLALVHKHFPGRDPDPAAMIEAAWLEQDHWKRMEVAIANGIARAVNGK
ncbi:DUF6890 family protein [Marinobacter nanhaiticus]